MSEHIETPIECGCDPFTSAEEVGTCGPCRPNQALTCEEEAILTRMREIKDQVRSISSRMKQLQTINDVEPSGRSGQQDDSEWRELFSQLDELRGRWSQWQRRLDEAIERKLILLGHREPS